MTAEDVLLVKGCWYGGTLGNLFITYRA